MSDDELIVDLPYGWEPREYQEPVWDYMLPERDRQRACCVWHRRAGKDLLAINLIQIKAFQRVGTYWHLFPEFKQARAVIWNGITTEGKRYIDHFKPELVRRTYENEMRVNLINGSNYYLVGSDNYDGLMGTNPVGIVLSEYSLQKPEAWQYLVPILAENRGWALFIYTFRGRNHGWFQAKIARQEGWFYDERIGGSGPKATKRPDGTPVVSDEEIDKLRAEGIPEATIQSEYFNNPEAPIIGAYYAKQMVAVKADGRRRAIPYDGKFPVYTAWDIGYDMTVVIYFQVIWGWVHILECEFKSGEGLPYWVGKVKEKSYEVYDYHFAPWDIDTREYAAGKSRMAMAAELGIKFIVTPQKPGNAGILDGIEQVRTMLPKCVFNEPKCEMLLEGLRCFRSEIEQEKMQFTGEEANEALLLKANPLHDWASHFDAAMRTLAWNLPKIMGKKRAMPDKAEDTYSYT